MPANSVIGLLRVLLTAETAQLETGLSKAKTQVKAFETDVQRFNREFGSLSQRLREGEQATGGFTGAFQKLNGALGGLLPAISAAGVGLLVKQFTDASSQLVDMRQNTGLSLGALQRFKFGAEQTGTSIDAIVRAIQFAQKAMSEGDKSFVGGLRQIGLSLDDVRAMKPETMFEEISSRIAAIQDPAQRTALRMTLLGKTGRELGADFKALGNEADRLGLVMSDKTVEAGDELGDNFDKLIGVGKTLIGSVLSPLLPILNGLASAMVFVLGPLGKLIGGFMDFLNPATRLADLMQNVITPALQAFGLAAQDLPKVTGDAAKGVAAWKQSVEDRGKIPIVDALAHEEEITRQLTDTVRGNTKAWSDAAVAAKKAQEDINAASDALNETQRKQLETLDAIGATTTEVMVHALEPFIEKLNLAKAQGVIPLQQALINLSPELEKLRERALAAGADINIFDGILNQLRADAGLTAEAMIALEQSIPIRPWTDALGKMQQYDVAGEQVRVNQGLLTDALQRFGITSREELQKTADQAVIDYQRIVDTYGEKSREAIAAHEKMVEAINAASGTIPSMWEADVFPRLTRVFDGIQSSLNDALLGMRSQSAQEHQRLADAAISNYDRIVAEATADYNRVKDSGTASAADIQKAHAEMTQKITDAHAKMQDAIEKASHPFRDTIVDIFKDMGRGIMQVFSDILADFENRFLKGLLGALSGKQGAFGQAFAGLFGGGGQGLLAGLIPGLGGPAGTATGIGTAIGAGPAIAPVPGLGGGAAAGAGVGLSGILGGVGAGAAGFGLGALFQQWLGRGVGSAAAGAGSGAASGALIGSIVPGLGTAIGALVGAIGGLVGGLINFGPSKQEREARAGVSAFQQDTFANLSEAQRKEAQGAGWADPTAAGTLIAVRDAYIEMGKSAQDAERDVKAIWDAEKEGPAATAAAMAPVLAALEEYKKKHGEAAAATDAAINQEKAKFTELKEHITSEMSNLDKELEGLNKSEAPEEHMGREEKLARDRIAKKQAELKQQLADAEAASKATIDAIAAAAGEGGAAVGRSFSDGAKIGFDELRTAGGAAMDDIIAKLGVTKEQWDALSGTEWSDSIAAAAKQLGLTEEQIELLHQAYLKASDPNIAHTMGDALVDAAQRGQGALGEIADEFKRSATDGADWTKRAYTGCWGDIGEDGLQVARQLALGFKSSADQSVGSDGLGQISDFLRTGLGSAARDGASDIERALEDIHIPNISIPVRWKMENELPDGVHVPGYATGTPNLDFMDFGRESLVRLHGDEAVIPKSRESELAAKYAQPVGTTVQNYFTIQAWDGQDVKRVLTTDPTIKKIIGDSAMQGVEYGGTAARLFDQRVRSVR